MLPFLFIDITEVTIHYVQVFKYHMILSAMIYQWQKENGKLQSRVSELEKKLDHVKQAWDSVEEVDMEVKKKMQAIELALKFKEEALAEMAALKQNLIAKERKSSDELQAVCKKLIDVSISKMLYASVFVFVSTYMPQTDAMVLNRRKKNWRTWRHILKVLLLRSVLLMMNCKRFEWS